MMTDIARHGDGKPIRLRDIAERQDISKLYLSQLARPLKHAGLLKSVWGNKGGYMLNRNAAEIKLLDIIKAVDGPVRLIDCVSDPGQCERSEFCETIGVWRKINGAITATLENYSLADLANDVRPRVQAGFACPRI